MIYNRTYINKSKGIYIFRNSNEYYFSSSTSFNYRIWHCFPYNNMDEFWQITFRSFNNKLKVNV
jgi:hypothetical protein